MRIGIDGRVLLGRKTGDRTYTLNLLRALQNIDTPHECVLYLTREPDTLLYHELQGCNIRVSPPNLPYLWTLFRLPHLASEDALDVLHVQYMTPLRCPCPVVSTIHDISFRLHPEWFRLRDRLVMNTFVPGSIARTSALITPSKSAADNIAREYEYPRDRIFVTPEAADERFFESIGAIEARRCRVKFDIEGRYMLYVGNIQPRKNVARLIRAFVAARQERNISDQLLIAGQFGWKCDDARRELQRAEQMGYVRHLGYVSDDDLPVLYSEAVAFVFPTLHEGFGLPVLEAMASGTPVI
ncbi:MAG: glycosyltransferase family 4 protein, partial [Armatimonadota bacterium]